MNPQCNVLRPSPFLPLHERQLHLVAVDKAGQVAGEPCGLAAIRLPTSAARIVWRAGGWSRRSHAAPGPGHPRTLLGESVGAQTAVRRRPLPGRSDERRPLLGRSDGTTRALPTQTGLEEDPMQKDQPLTSNNPGTGTPAYLLSAAAERVRLHPDGPGGDPTQCRSALNPQCNVLRPSPSFRSTKGNCS